MDLNLSFFQVRKETPTIKKIHVDERDSKRPQRRKKMALESTLEERPSELLRHPGDVVAAAITIQRFFRRLKENNELKKMKKREMRRRTTTSDESSSSEEEEQTETRDSESDSVSGSEDTASDSSVTE